MEFRVGFGYDSHRLVVNRPLILGGIQIPFEKGCEAHSDGDALIHAVCDALLGAAGLSDIGSHFPDTDNQYKNIDSKILLKRVVEIIHSQAWIINNVDMTLLIEKPKIGPYRDQMVNCLSEILGVRPDRLAVKAKTNEKMGFVGSGDGVVAYAVCSLVKLQSN